MSLDACVRVLILATKPQTNVQFDSRPRLALKLGPRSRPRSTPGLGVKAESESKLSLDADSISTLNSISISSPDLGLEFSLSSGLDMDRKNLVYGWLPNQIGNERLQRHGSERVPVRRDA